MKQCYKTSISLCEDELAILDAIAQRMDISRSEVVRHLVLYSGMVGGDFPLTSKILALQPRERQRVTQEIRQRAEKNNPAKPQSFRQWVMAALGKDDKPAMERTGETLLRELLQMSPQGT